MYACATCTSERQILVFVLWSLPMYYSIWLWIGVGVVFATIVFAASRLSRRGGRPRDLGSVSASWIAEHRASKGYPS